MPVIDLQGNDLVQLDVNKSKKVLPGVATVEPVDGYWVGKSDWGQRVQRDFPSASGTIINLARVPKLPGPPRARSILLGRVFEVPSNLPTLSSAIRAKITYGGGGASGVIICDWLNGTALSIVASSIQVDAFTYAPTGVVYSNANQPKLDISAIIGTDASSQGHAPTFTANIITGVNSYVPIPQFANRVAIQGNVSAGTPTIGIKTNSDNFIYTAAEIKALGGAWINLPGDVVAITDGGVGTVGWSVTFGLAV